VLSGVAVPDSELLGLELMVGLTCGPLLSAEQATPAKRTPHASTAAATGRIAGRVGIIKPFMVPAYRRG
jgi:hypothetical protein